MMETNWFDLAKKICNPPMEKPQQYRILGPYEIIQKGDEWQAICNPLWGKVGTYVIGRTPKIFDKFEFRRPIPVAKSERVNTFEDPWAVAKSEKAEGVCIKCGATIDGTCIKCGQAHHVTVKEPLATDPDESSDNSRSFKEIERLKHINSELLTESNELYEKLQTAERERDEAKSKQLDQSILLSDILAAVDSSGVAIGDEYRAYTLSERVKNLGKAKDYFARQTDEARKERDTLRAENETLRNAQKAYDFATVGEVARFREALQNAAKVFRDYEEIHRAKGTLEADIKAESNASQAERLESALAGKGAQS